MEEKNTQQPTPQKQSSGGLFWSIIIIIIILAGGYFLFSGNGEVEEPTQDDISEVEDMDETSDEDSENDSEPVGGGPSSPNKQVTITYTDAGFSPSQVEINQGDSVLFVNESASGMWPASAMHPTHTVYPGSGIEKCGGAEEEGIFDSCGNVESYSFVFTEAGEWGYHNHSRANHFGKITVNEKPEGSL